MKKNYKFKTSKPIRRRCDCWLKVGTCFCSGNDKAIRFSVRKDGVVHSRWETLNEALTDARKRVGAPWEIYDNIEQEVRIKFEG